MMIVYVIFLFVISVAGSLLATEYQNCYRKSETFSFPEMKRHLQEKPLQFVPVLLIYSAFFILALCVYQQKHLNLVQLPQYILFWDCILISSWIDFHVKKMPNLIFLILLGARTVGIFAEMAHQPEEIISLILGSFSGMLLGGGIILICRLISRGGIGAGDVKLFALVGYYFGIIPMMNILFYTVFLAAFGAIILLLTKKAKMKSTLALGPFAFIGLNIYYLLLS